MQSNKSRAAVLVGLVVVAVALFVVLKDDSDDSGDSTAATDTTATNATGTTSGPATEPASTEIVVRNGRPVDGPAEIEVAKGEMIRFEVSSDSDGNVHVHGYDTEKKVSAGSTVAFDFPAKLEGGYEIEMHLASGEDVPLGKVTITP